ncbi:MAG: hypothetical protein WAO91_04640 [Candidatus Nitrosotenuis sp.]
MKEVGRKIKRGFVFTGTKFNKKLRDLHKWKNKNIKPKIAKAQTSFSFVGGVIGFVLSIIIAGIAGGIIGLFVGTLVIAALEH